MMFNFSRLMHYMHTCGVMKLNK
uniref:Uncharacterized protein n=1 Tax=Rhizophora mucronata TaxID=61149 RepID=A0A2P2PK85_RHIMU